MSRWGAIEANLDFLDDTEKKIQQLSGTYKILVADDDDEVHKVTDMVLKDFIFEDRSLEVLHAYSGAETIRHLQKTDNIAVLFLDVVMENRQSGLEVVKFIRDQLQNEDIRIVLRTGQPGEAPENQVIREYDINDYHLKSEFTDNRLHTALYSALRGYRDLQKIRAYQVSLEKMNRMNTYINEAQKDIILTLANTVDSHFTDSGSHVKRIAEMMYRFAVVLGYDHDEAEALQFASTMHDLGKIVIPDAILKKPGKLTEEEFEVMKTHSAAGYYILKDSNLPMLKIAAAIALNHHERYDGFGYPNGISGEAIPKEARMMTIVDVYDAMSHKRIYKDAIEQEVCLDWLKEQKGKQFDQALTEVFIENLDEILGR